MKLTGLTPEQVDQEITSFYLLMHSSMRVMMTLVSQDVQMAMTPAVTAAGEAGDGDISMAVDALGHITAEWNSHVNDTLKPALNAIVVKAADAVATPLSDVTPIKTTQFLESSEQWLGAFASELWMTAKNSLVAGVNDGESIAELAARVQNVAKMKEKKAFVIAQTTVIAAINGGEWHQMMEAAAAFEAVTIKEWVATEDSHTRPTHHAADGQRVDLAAHFDVGGGMLLFPGDPSGPPEEVINCRCTVVYEMADDEPDEQISQSETSPETLSTDSAVATNGGYWPMEDDDLVAAGWDPLEHPRGKDGKFIKSSVVGGWVKNILSGKYDYHDLVGSEKKVFVSDLGQLKAKEWNNFKPEQKAKLTKALEDAVDEGIPGSAHATAHVEDIDDGDIDLGEREEVFNPHTKMPSTPSAKAAKGLEKDIYDAYDAGIINDAQQQNMLNGLDSGQHDAVAKELAKYTGYDPEPVALTTGSNTPVKVTHGLIHAKHTPGTVIAQTNTGIKVTWNGSSYDISNASGGGEKGVKKSKLYALLNGPKYQYAAWTAPGKQETAVSHVKHLDAAPPAAPVPHPVAPKSVWDDMYDKTVAHSVKENLGKLGTPIAPKPSKVDELLDETFGPVNTGLAPTPGLNTAEIMSSLKTGTAKPGDVIAVGNVGSKNFRLVVAKHSSGMNYISKQEENLLNKGNDDWEENGKIFNKDDFDATLKSDNAGGLSWAPAPASTVTSLEDINALADEWEAEAPGNLATFNALAKKSMGAQTLSTPNVAKVHDLTGWKKVGGQSGSNKGGLYQAPNGEQFYVKSLKSEDHVKNEVLAAALYNAADVNVPNVQHGANHPEGWKNVVVSPIVKNSVSAKSKLLNDPSFKGDVQSGYAIDAWLANHDVVGMTHDNIVDANGKPWRIDMGGSLLYRAQGDKKQGWGPDPSAELNGLKDPDTNSQAAGVFGDMTLSEETASAKRLVGVSNAQIDQLVKDAGLSPSLADTLKKRKKAILDKYNLTGFGDEKSGAKDSLTNEIADEIGVLETIDTGGPVPLPGITIKTMNETTASKWDQKKDLDAQLNDLYVAGNLADDNVTTNKIADLMSEGEYDLAQQEIDKLKVVHGGPPSTKGPNTASLQYQYMKQMHDPSVSQGTKQSAAIAWVGYSTSDDWDSLTTEQKTTVSNLITAANLDDDNGAELAGAKQFMWEQGISDELPAVVQLQQQHDKGLLTDTEFANELYNIANVSVAPGVVPSGNTYETDYVIDEALAAPINTPVAWGVIPATGGIIEVFGGPDDQNLLVKSPASPNTFVSTSTKLFKHSAVENGITQWNLGEKPGVPAAASSAPTVTADDIGVGLSYAFYSKFKANKVSPSWSGAKIYSSMQDAKAHMSGDPQFAQLSDLEMLKILDKHHAKSGFGKPKTAYTDKVSEWLKTPNGQKAFKAANSGVTPSLAPSIAKKVTPAKKAPSLPALSPGEALGTVDLTVDTSKLYDEVKAGASGNSVHNDAVDIYANLWKVAKANNTSVASVVHAMDVETAKKYGTVSTTYKQKMNLWLTGLPSLKTAGEIQAGVWTKPSPPPVKKFAKKAAKSGYGGYGGSSSYTHAATKPLDEKVKNLTHKIESFDPNKAYVPKYSTKTLEHWKKPGEKGNDFPMYEASEAKSLWSQWTKNQGNITEQQKASLKYYTTSSGAHNMNSYLRGYSGATDATQAHVNNAQAGMKLSETPMILHRGNGWFAGWSNVEEVKKKVGEDFTQEAFFSTSVGGKSAFSGAINFIVEAPVGTPMAYVKGFSHYGSEDEMLLGANIKYRVVSVHTNDIDGSWHYNTQVTVVLRAIPHEDVTS